MLLSSFGISIIINYNIYVKMAIDGVTCPAFSSITLPPYSNKNDNRDIIIDRSRQKYSKDRGEVERVINESMDSISIQTKPKEDGAKYPRPVPNNYLEIKSQATGDIFYAKGDTNSGRAPSVIPIEKVVESPVKNLMKIANTTKIEERVSKNMLFNALNNPVEKKNDLFDPERALKITDEQIKRNNQTLIVEDNIQPIEEDTTIKL